MRRTQVPFLTCNISQSFPQCLLPNFLFLNESSWFRRSYAPPIRSGGIVFGVGFGGVSNGVGAGRIECTRATPVTYYRDRRKSPLDAARWPRYGLSGSTLDAMPRSRYNRSKSPLDAARWPRYGLSGNTLDVMRRSRYDRRKSPLDAACWPHDGSAKGTLAAVHWSLL
jgi:hypothetical protein